MAGAQLAPDVGTRRYAIGLDLAAPLLQVARRGFSSTFSNQMGQFGGWISTTVDPGLASTRADRPPSTPVLHLADDLAGTLAARESGHPEQLRVGVAAPSWLGWCDRHHICQLVDPGGRSQLVWASSPVVAAFGTNLAGHHPLDDELVVAVDLDMGISASIVAIHRDGVRELFTTNASPSSTRQPSTVSATIAELAALAHMAGVRGVARVVVVADDSTPSAVLEQATRAIHRGWAHAPIELIRSRAEIARAAVLLADMDSFEIVGAAPRSIGVLGDDPVGGGSQIHSVVGANWATPVRADATFDLGPDDGAHISLEVFEEHPDDDHPPSRRGDLPGHRQIITAHLSDARLLAVEPGTSRRDDVELSFVVGADGQLRVEPTEPADTRSWTIAWAASTLVAPSARASVRQFDDVGQPVRGLASTSARRGARQLAPPLGLGEALGRAERIVSRQLGRMIAIRSAMALLGCGDGDAVEVLSGRAELLDRVLQTCPSNDATPAMQVALEAARRALASPACRIFAGGSARDVSRELQRVVEHLAVVIGAVTPAERNRLILDGQLLGFDHHAARVLVDELIHDAGVDSDGRPEALRDRTALVTVSADGFRLMPLGSQVGHDQTVMRVLLLDA